ncbi:MAG: BspA family leucine-rich repeat surface protein [Muribaculaceae bacterium]|nr:BspA family leucine-rich repeat surface protein [Muribaculaceae bacterium]
MKRLLLLLVATLVCVAMWAAEPCAVYTSNNSTLTFYYDNVTHSGDVRPFPTGDLSRPWWSSDTNVSSNVQKVVFDPSFSLYHHTSGYYWFAGMTNLTSIEGLEYFNTDMMVNMRRMFSECSSLTSLDLSHFNTAEVTNMYDMFMGCSGLTGLNLSSFDTRKVSNMSGMFAGCSNLSSLDVTSFNTSKVFSMRSMFYNCAKLSILELSGFDTGKVTSMKDMFQNCSSLATIYAGNNWTTSYLLDLSESVFEGCTSLVGGKGTTYDSSRISAYYARNDGGTGSPGYFSSHQAAAVYNSSTKTLTFYYDDVAHSGHVGTLPSSSTSQPWWSSDTNVSGNVQKVVFDPSFSLYHHTSGYYWFAGMTNLTSIVGLEYFNTDKMVNMNGMFKNCSKLTSLDLSHFNTAEVTNMYCMFLGCSGLTGLNLSSFDTRKVVNMSEMFSGCSNLASLDVTNFNTSDVTTMLGMFRSCAMLATLDLSCFDTGKVTETASMFYGCGNLTTIIAGESWDMSSVTESNYMFRNCSKIVGGSGTIYDSNHTNKEYAHVDGGLSNPGYLSYYDDNLIYHAGLWYKAEQNTSFNELTLVRPQNGATYSGEVDIPDAFNRNGTVWAVTGISEGAFTRTAVTSVTVPPGLTRIENRAFYGAQNLKTLLLATDKAPNKLTLGTDFIGDNASSFACYVKNNNLPAWQLRYSSVNFLPWELTRENGFLTFSCVRDVTLPEGLSAYTVTGFNTARRMATSTQLTNRKIPANNGVILKGSPSTRYLFSAATSAPSLGSNMLRPLNGIEDIPYAPFAANPDDTKAYFLGNSCVDWYEFQNNIDLFMALNTGIAYLAVDKTLLGGDYTSHVLLDLWSATEPVVGDVDGSGVVDVSDVNAVINIILKTKQPSDYPGNPDIDNSGVVDVSDVNAIINIILKLN